MNGLVVHCGTHEDYDRWAGSGAVILLGLGMELPYFKKVGPEFASLAKEIKIILNSIIGVHIHASKRDTGQKPWHLH